MIYFDSAYIAKFYLTEPDSARVKALAESGVYQRFTHARRSGRVQAQREVGLARFAAREGRQRVRQQRSRPRAGATHPTRARPSYR